MPNVAVEVRRGVICHTPIAPRRAATALRGALDAVQGPRPVIEVEEELIDAATAVMGCARAYLRSSVEELIESGVDAGLAPALSERLVREAASGTGDLLGRYDAGRDETAIASPGGSTEAGLDAFAERRRPRRPSRPRSSPRSSG